MPPAPPAAPKKGVSLPGSPILWVGVLAVVVVGGGYLIWKRNQNSTAAATTADTSGTSTDTSSNAGEIGTLQSEIGDLQSSEAQDTVQVQVPNVVGQKQEDAFGTISGAGLHPAGAKVQPGKILYVTAQAPAGGVLVKKGTTVALQSSVRAPAKKKPAPKPKKKVAA
jgi:PASTA domain